MENELTQKAHVHCVIVGFSSAPNPKPKIIFDGDKKFVTNNIKAYLLDALDIFVESRPKHLQDFVPPMIYGNKPVDGGNFLFTPEELADFLKREPAAEKYIRQILGADEFINCKLRYCLWLLNATPNELKRIPLVYQRVKNVREFRLNSTFEKFYLVRAFR